MDFEAKLQAFIDAARTKAKDGLTLEEAFTILYDFVVLATGLAEDLRNPGPEKRAIVLQWVGILFDTLAPLVVSALPIWLKWYHLLVPFVRPANRQIVLAIAAAILERVYPKG